MTYREVLTTINPQSSHHKDHFSPFTSFVSLYFIYLRCWMLAEPIVIIMSQQIQNKSSCCTTSIYTVICVSYFSKKKKLEKRKPNTFYLSFSENDYVSLPMIKKKKKMKGRLISLLEVPNS